MAETIEVHEEIAPVAAEWDSLALATAASPFARPGWIGAWWDAFGAGPLRVFAARRDGALVGVLPLGGDRAVSSPTNWHTPGFSAVAVDEAAVAALWRAVFAGRPRRVDVSFLVAGGADADACDASAERYRVVSRVAQRSPFVAVEGEWDAYWGSLSKNLRGTVRRCRNRLADRGTVAFEILSGEEDLEARLEEGFRLEASGWKGEAGTAILSQPETARFYEAICRWAADAGILRLAFLRIDGVAVAFNLCFEDPRRHYLLKPGHDAALDALGPGTVLTAELVERAFHLGLESYEFLGGPDRYKLRWTDACRELLRVQCFAPTLGGRADRLVQTHGRALAKRVLRRDG